ncbi:MAG TPA: ATP synthase F1 subunit delta [Bacteroidota bacterium]|nr:ATP synthase F1 subunit delta [Bacteroidota bacterium]
MSNTRVAKRYASALMALTGEAKKPEAVADDLMTVQTAIKASRELRSLLVSPVISKEKKKAVVAELFNKKIGDVVQQYLASIIEKRREDVLAEVLEQYFLLRDEQLGIVAVDVRTAVKFSGDQEKKLVQQLESFTQKKVRVSFSLDKVLKGGFVARVGDTTLDGSISRQLELLRSRLKNGSASKN